MAKFRIYNQAIDKVRSTNFETNGLAVALTASAPDNSHTTLSQLTEIDYTHLVGDRGLTIINVDEGDDGNPFRVIVADKPLTAEGGEVGPFRYVHVYDLSTDDLLFHYDLEDDLTIEDGTTLNLDFSQSLGVFSVRFNPL